MSDTGHKLGIAQGLHLLDVLEAAGITPEQARAISESPDNVVAILWLSKLPEVLEAVDKAAQLLEETAPNAAE